MTAVYGGVATVLLVVIAAVALVLQPPAPPAVAEFAPQAVDRIDEAPRDQASAFGAGDGNCAEGVQCEGLTTTTTIDGAGSGGRGTTHKPVDKARVLRCVGNPPRQIEDPQSPPCANYWEGDNGGSTWQGVSRDEIRIGWRSNTPENERVEDNFVEFFNRRFQFYGRKLRLVRYSAGADPSQPAAMRAAAEQLHELGVFASMPYSGGFPAGPFYDDLARNGILSISDSGEFSTERGDYSAKAPFQWSYLPPADAIGRNAAEWMCKTLAHRTADRAGPGVRGKDRKFAVVVVRWPGGTRDTSDLESALQRCDVRVVRVETDQITDSSDPRLRTMVADLQQDNVTSIACYCGAAERGGFMEAASDVRYYPEWLNLPFTGQGADFDGENQPADQRGQVFGITATNKWNRWSDAPWFWALREIDPDHQERPLNRNVSRRASEQYEPLLLLASGIQLAGPTLTPHTFQSGLFAARFPNPGAGQGPYYQARVGFGPGDHSMVDDFAAIWYDPTAESYYDSGPGSHCYIGRGTRWLLGMWPTTPLPFFDATSGCR